MWQRHVRALSETHVESGEGEQNPPLPQSESEWHRAGEHTFAPQVGLAVAHVQIFPPLQSAGARHSSNVHCPFEQRCASVQSASTVHVSRALVKLGEQDAGQAR